MDKIELKAKIVENIAGRLEHANYKRVCDLAKLYSQIISGKDSNELLQQFVPREDPEMFKQRVNLTQQITSSISWGIIKTFNKVFRTKPSKEVIDFEKSSEEKVEKVKNALSTIYGKKDIYKYIQDKFLYLSFCDPNSFIYTTFGAFDAKVEVAKPYNSDISSYQAINYEYFNDILQWLVSKECIMYVQEGKDFEGFKWTIYGPQFAYVYTQVGKDYKAQAGEVVETVVIDEEAEKYEYFIVVEYEHKSKVIPLIQVGYERDLQTEGATFVSPIEPGMPYFMKLIKEVSEFDLTMALHAFPQKFQYVEKCTFTLDGNCTTSGQKQEKCKTCNKTGIPVHTSAQDSIILKMPRPEDMKDALPLEQMVHYEYPPVELLTFQNEMIEKHGAKVNKSVFNSETFTKDQIAKTATGENIDMQNVYDTLKPFAEKVSDVWEHITMVSANYLDLFDIIVDHSYPDDFKFKDTETLINDLNKATSGGASGYILTGIEDDIMRRMYIDSPVEFQKYQAKQKFFPFKGKTREEIQQIMLSGQVRENDIILYNYFETIFTELETEYEEKEKWFYGMTTKIQREEIDRKINEIKAEIDSDKAIIIGEMVS